MKSKTAFARYICIVALAVFCFFTVFTILPTDIAEAVLPENYVEYVKDKSGEYANDWQTASEYLNLEEVKSTVKGWMNSARDGLSGLESDPIVIAVIDSGVNFTHEIFVGEYDEDGAPIDTSDVGEYDVFFRDADNDIIGTNTVSKTGQISTSIMDNAPDMHGTHVCGIIATLIHELDLEKYIKIMPIKAAYPDGSGSSFNKNDVAAAISFALSHGASIVNMSLCDLDDKLFSPSAFKNLVSQTDAENAVFVAAAGNNSKDSNKTKGYPAASENVVGVMNYTYTTSGGMEIASSSNYGGAYDLCAPGFRIWSARGDLNVADPQTYYKTLSGTSMASPIVAFAAALLEMKFRTLDALYTMPQIKQGLLGAFSNTIAKGTYEFKALDLLKIATYDVVKLNITANVNTAQLIDEIEEITFTVLGGNEESVQNLTWYLLVGDAREEIGSGRSINFTPQNEIGTWGICVELVEDGILYGSAQTRVSVSYASLNSPDTKIVTESGAYSNLQISTNDKLTFVLNVPYNSNPNLTVMWYVNGEYVSSGEKLVCEFDKEGRYVIKAYAHNEYVGGEFVVVVKDIFFTPIVIASISTTGACVIVVFVIAIVILARRRGRPDIIV